MTQVMLHFVDPSIPGLSGRDLMRKAFSGVSGLRRRVGNSALTKSSGQTVFTRDLHLLRDIGLDRNGI